MLRFLFIVATTGCIVSGTLNAQAQQSTRVGVGSVVRITPYSGKRIVGAVYEIRSDSLMILKRDKKQSVEMHIAQADIQRVQVNGGRSRAAGALVKGGFGLFAGALVGALVGYVSYEEPPPATNLGEALVRCIFGCSAGANAAIGAFTLGSVGFIVGTIYGSVTGIDNWVDVPRR